MFGVAGHQRTELLREACAARGTSLTVMDYNTVLAADFVPPAAAWYKLDAPGQDEALDLALLQLGQTTLRAREPGEVHARPAWFRGFGALLQRIAAALPTSARWLNPPTEVLDMTDKLRCQQRLQQAGASVPELLGPIESFDGLVERMDVADIDQVFLKSRYGSSASGVVALRRASGGRWSACSSARLSAGRLYNHLRPQRLHEHSSIAALVDAICRETGAYAERWLPKPRVPGSRDQCYDLRVMVHRGQPRQCIARQSRSALTNLHLGNQRADPDWLDAGQRSQLHDATAAVQRAFPLSATVGADVLLHGGRAQVLELNAFGDLLHGVRFEGRSTYEDQAMWCQA